MNFSREQIKAITHGDGPALVIAGPGSGKTAVLTYRIKYLIEHKGISPENILVITFSKSASLEMYDRFNNLNLDNYYPVNFGTFHSIFFKIIFNKYHYTTSNIMNNRQKRDFMREALSRLNIVNNPETELLDMLIREVSYYKNSNEQEFAGLDTLIDTNNLYKIYKEYRNLQICANKIDFEDMMLIVRNLFIKDKEVLEEYRKKYRYILIDEYQDINDIQNEIINLLTSRKNNLWVCGDDDQSIYGFRGSQPSFMLNFGKKYPEAKLYKLQKNYRCSEAIIKASVLVIKENKERYYKNITGNNNLGVVDIKGFNSSEDENNYIIDRIKDNRGNNKIAILFRTNIEVSKMAHYLIENGISLNVSEPLFNPYNTYGFNIIMNYLLLSLDTYQLSVRNLLVILNKPLRYLRRDNISGDSVTFKQLKYCYKGNINAVSAINTLECQINILSSLPDLYSKINYIRKGIGIDEYIRLTSTSGDVYENYIEAMSWIMEDSRKIADVAKLNSYAKEYEQSIQERTNNKNYDNNSLINIMTYHASKGLEFDEVYLPHLNEGYVPHKKSSSKNIEEERRLFYVAMTRAKRNLYITYVSGNDTNKKMMSRFLYPIIYNK